MALKGNLRDFTITQLLNLINLANKTGTLIIDGSSDSALISFKDGNLAFSQLGNVDNGLASVLYREKKITPTQYKIIRSKASHMGDKELGLLLINANYLTQADILTSLRNEFVSVLKRIFTWVDGLFRFEDGALPPDDKITLKISLENIIIEGSRQLREWEHLQDEIPSLDVALKFSDRPGKNVKNINLSVEEWRVVSYINPKNSLKKIAHTTKMDDLTIRKIIYGLLQAGIVELVRPEGLKPPVPIQKQITLPTDNPEEQKSLIYRIINRIRSL
jgi:hypothetical protein